ncbi:MAG TPA: penicillin acylase family protein [Solirubrobacterales bacterium]|jgi:penicillin amidase|nr:penicillin acylase family protein [Solirubrobacterales bacterium]
MSLFDHRRAARAGLLAGAAGTGLAAATTAAAWHWLARRPLPRQEGTIEVDGLEGPVRVRRDRWGVPHIEAAGRSDLNFAQGFCHGQDRLWQLDFYRRVVSGRLSEMAGEEGLPIDRLMRTLGIRRTAEREAAELDPELLALLERFCEGVNAAAASARAMPFEMQLLRLGSFQPWRPVDILGLGKLLAFGLSTNWERELLRADMVRALGPELTAKLDPSYPGGNPVVTQEAWSGDGLAIAEQIDAVRRGMGLAAEASGSNNWAVSGALSATGSPLIAGDPHLPPSMPGIWYQVGLTHGDRFVRGASLPGMPGVYMGQNNDVCWTFTNVMADVQDLFVERVDGDRYLFEDEWRPLEVVREEIAVKGRAEPEVLDVRITHHGPIVNEALGADDAEPLALRWLTLDEPTSFKGMFELYDIGSGPELVAKLEGHSSPASNLVWADRHGSIGYKLIGRLPLRRGGCPDLPKPGWTGEFEWEGVIPYEELPETTDPESGFLVTANNRIVGDSYPHHITSEWLDGFRARRIEELLRRSDEHDIDGFEVMQTDSLSIPGLEAARRLGRLAPAGQRERSAIERLRSWDGRLDPETIAGTIYQAFLLRLAREVARAVIGDRDLAERWLDRADNGFTPHVTSPWRWHSHLMGMWEEGDEELIGRPWDELALEVLSGALDDLGDRFGPDPEGWRWGRVHEMEFPHPLGEANPLLRKLLNRRLRAGGAQETVSQIAYDPNDPYKAVWAPSWRMVADPTAPERSRWQMFTGQSGHPASPHYDDLQSAWLEGRTQPMAGEGPWRELDLLPF